MDGYRPHPTHRTGYCELGIHGRRRRQQRTNHFQSQSEWLNLSARVEAVVLILHQSRFDIELSPESLHFVFLNSRYLVEDATWPMFTLLGQSLGSMYLAWEAISKQLPDLFIGKTYRSS